MEACINCLIMYIYEYELNTQSNLPKLKSRKLKVYSSPLFFIFNFLPHI